MGEATEGEQQPPAHRVEKVRRQLRERTSDTSSALKRRGSGTVCWNRMLEPYAALGGAIGARDLGSSMAAHDSRHNVRAPLRPGNRPHDAA